MREFLDAILAHIDSESLTDEEFDSLEITVPNYSTVTYLALKSVLDARESISNQSKRLKLYFISRGVSVSELPKAYNPKSNILIGISL